MDKWMEEELSRWDTPDYRVEDPEIHPDIRPEYQVRRLLGTHDYYVAREGFFRGLEFLHYGPYPSVEWAILALEHFFLGKEIPKEIEAAIKKSRRRLEDWLRKADPLKVVEALTRLAPMARGASRETRRGWYPDVDWYPNVD